jgi:hypothetical protein
VSWTRRLARLVVTLRPSTVTASAFAIFESMDGSSESPTHLQSPTGMIGASHSFRPSSPRPDLDSLSLAMIKRAITSAGVPETLRKDLKPNVLSDIISKCKSFGSSPAQYRAQQANVENPAALERMDYIAKVYE